MYFDVFLLISIKNATGDKYTLEFPSGLFKKKKNPLNQTFQIQLHIPSFATTNQFQCWICAPRMRAYKKQERPCLMKCPETARQ